MGKNQDFGKNGTNMEILKKKNIIIIKQNLRVFILKNFEFI